MDKRILLFFISFVFSFLLFSYWESFLRIVSLIFSIPLDFFFFLLFLVFLEFFLQVLRYWLVFRKPILESIEDYAVGHFVAFSFPSRSLGELARAKVFSKLTNSTLEKALSFVFVVRAIDVFILLSSSLFFLPLSFSFFAVAMLLLFFFVLEFFDFEKHLFFLPKFFKEYLANSREITKNRPLFFSLFLLSLVLWFFDFYRVFLIAHYFNNIFSDFFYVVSSVSATYLFSALSFLPGGLLFYEGGLVGFLKLKGFPLDKAISVVLIERFFSYWLWLVIGFLFSLKKLKGKIF